MVPARLPVVLLVVALLAALPARGDAQEAERARLQEARARVEAVRREIAVSRWRARTGG